MSGALLTFEPATHAYRTPDGRQIPSVTQILRACGISTDFDAVRALSARRADAIDHKRDLGVAVHADAHAYDDDDLEIDTVDPEVRPYLDAWITFRQNYGLVPAQRERRLYSPTLDVCGTLDAVGYRAADPGAWLLIDIKTGDPESAAARYQTAGYQLLWEEEHPEAPIAERWSVELTPGLRVPYRVHNYSIEPDAWRHAQAFRAFVTTYQCQAARRAS